MFVSDRGPTLRTYVRLNRKLPRQGGRPSRRPDRPRDRVRDPWGVRPGVPGTARGTVASSSSSRSGCGPGRIPASGRPDLSGKHAHPAPCTGTLGALAPTEPGPSPASRPSFRSQELRAPVPLTLTVPIGVTYGGRPGGPADPPPSRHPASSIRRTSASPNLTARSNASRDTRSMRSLGQ